MGAHREVSNGLVPTERGWASSTRLLPMRTIRSRPFPEPLTWSGPTTTSLDSPAASRSELTSHGVPADEQGGSESPGVIRLADLAREVTAVSQSLARTMLQPEDSIRAPKAYQPAEGAVNRK